MPTPSILTQYLPPLVSQATMLSDVASQPVLDLTNSRFLPRATTVSATSLVLADGELAVTELTGTAATLAFRSGNTTYKWSSTTARVL